MNGDLAELQHKIRTFTRDCVPGPPASYALKAQHEAAELVEACQEGDDRQVAEEAADVLICLIGAALGRNITLERVVDAALCKMDVNLARTWSQQPDGTWQHVTPAKAVE